MNKRRKLIVALGAGALAAPFVSFAQTKGKVWRIGFLTGRDRPESLDSSGFGVFLRGMRELGYFEEKNLKIEWRFADGRYESLPGMAAELVRLKVDMIFATGTPAIGAAQKSTTTIPIVMVDIADPVGAGFVKSLANPGGNITGLSNLNVDISPKLLEMLISMVPKLSRVAVLVNPANPSTALVLKSVQAAAQRVKVMVQPVEAQTPQEIEKAFSAMARGKAGAVIVPREALFLQQMRLIAELAAKNRLPCISMLLEYVEAGGLMGYGSSATDIYRRAATYVDKILKGARPGDLPVEQPTKFELIINRRTAKALGLKIPQSLLISADKVIE
jgi:putative ABC transport system substrate-binding protein